MQEFHPGFLSMMKGTAAPVVPVYLGGLWGSIFSFEGGRFFWKWPRRLPYPGDASTLAGRSPQPADVAPVRQAVEQLGTRAMQQRPSHELNLPRKFLRMCRGALLRSKVADSSGAELTGAKLLMGTLVLRRVLRREVLGRDEQQVGLLLPPSVGSVLANAALTIDRRIAVNLNYTVSSDVMNQCIAQCGIRHVLTSPRLLERFPLKIDAERGLPRRPQEEDHLGRQADRRRPDLAVAGGRAGTLARPDADQDGRPAHGDVHLGLDRPAQGRDAHASQRGLERRGGRRDRPPGPARRAAGRAADVPFVRLHHHALDGADAGAEGASITTRRWSRGRSASSAGSTA